MIDCPVDGIKNIKGNKCPQCDTDLTPLLHFRNLPEKYFQDGIDLLKTDRIDAAVEKLITALSFDTKDIKINIALGEAYFKKGLYKEALDQMEAALQIDPENQNVKSKIYEIQKRQENERKNIIKEKRKLKMLRGLLVGIPIVTFLIGLVIIPLKNNLVREAPINLTIQTDQIAEKISQFPELKSLNVNVSSTGQKIYLSGEVPSILHRNFITYLAGNVAPDSLVDNSNLRIHVPEKEPTEKVQYTVRRGESLALIAYSFYNDINKWAIIAKANNITNPNYISEGQVLLLPLIPEKNVLKN
ncbi:MAG: LysM peptidoglycan-binding domain-containing protein [Thermodesulfobacteriota bacterium]